MDDKQNYYPNSQRFGDRLPHFRPFPAMELPNATSNDKTNCYPAPKLKHVIETEPIRELKAFTYTQQHPRLDTCKAQYKSRETK